MKKATGWKVKWGHVGIGLATLVLALVLALCQGCSGGPPPLTGSEVPIRLEKGDVAPEAGWLLSEAAFAEIQEVLSRQDAKIQALELERLQIKER